jgi:hypothetical protein
MLWIGAYRIGDVGALGTCGARVGDHALEHLRGCYDGLAHDVCLCTFMYKQMFEKKDQVNMPD